MLWNFIKALLILLVMLSFIGSGVIKPTAALIIVGVVYGCKAFINWIKNP